MPKYDAAELKGAVKSFKQSKISIKAKTPDGTANKELSLEEKGAIVKYVSPDAYALNDKLRRKASSELTELDKEWIKNLDNTLGKLPNYEGNLNRSLTFTHEEDAEKDRFKSIFRIQKRERTWEV